MTPPRQDVEAVKAALEWADHLPVEPGRHADGFPGEMAIYHRVKVLAAALRESEAKLATPVSIPSCHKAHKYSVCGWCRAEQAEAQVKALTERLAQENKATVEAYQTGRRRQREEDAAKTKRGEAGE